MTFRKAIKVENAFMKAALNGINRAMSFSYQTSLQHINQEKKSTSKEFG